MPPTTVASTQLAGSPVLGHHEVPTDQGHQAWGSVAERTRRPAQPVSATPSRNGNEKQMVKRYRKMSEIECVATKMAHVRKWYTSQKIFKNHFIVFFWIFFVNFWGWRSLWYVHGVSIGPRPQVPGHKTCPEKKRAIPQRSRWCV